MLYVLLWAALLDGLETFGPNPEIWPISAALPAASALGSWPALFPAPAICLLFRHENDSDGDAHEGAREFRESRWRQAVMADMTKWGFGEASGARGPLARLRILGMLGVGTIMGDSLSGLVRLLELTSAILPAHRRRS